MVTDLRTGTQYFDEAFPAFVSYFVQIAYCNLLCQLLRACAYGQIRVIFCDSSCRGTNWLFSSSEKEGVWNRGSWGSRAVGQEREGSFIFPAKGVDGWAVGRECYPASAGTTGSLKSALAIAKRCPVIGHARPLSCERYSKFARTRARILGFGKYAPAIRVQQRVSPFQEFEDLGDVNLIVVALFALDPDDLRERWFVRQKVYFRLVQAEESTFVVHRGHLEGFVFVVRSYLPCESNVCVLDGLAADMSSGIAVHGGRI